MTASEISTEKAPEPPSEDSAEPKKKKSLLRRLRRVLLYLLIGFVLAEVLLRLFGGIPAIFGRFGGGRENMKMLIELLDADDECGFGLKPLAQAETTAGEHTVRSTVDENGYRTMPPGDSAAPIILVLGDSNAFGWGVADDQTYSYFLAQNLKKYSGVMPRVINGGVPGYSILRSERRLKKMIEGVKPAVVIMQVSANNNSNMSSTAEKDLIANPEIFIDMQNAFHRPLAIGQLFGLLGAVKKHSWAWTGNREPSFNVSYQEMQEALDRLVNITASVGSKLIVISIYAPQLMMQRDTSAQYQVKLERMLKNLEKQNRARILVSRELFTVKEWKSGIDTRHPDASGHALIAEKLQPLVLEALAPPRPVAPAEPVESSGTASNSEE